MWETHKVRNEAISLPPFTHHQCSNVENALGLVSPTMTPMPMPAPTLSLVPATQLLPSIRVHAGMDTRSHGSLLAWSAMRWLVFHVTCVPLLSDRKTKWPGTMEICDHEGDLWQWQQLSMMITSTTDRWYRSQLTIIPPYPHKTAWLCQLTLALHLQGLLVVFVGGIPAKRLHTPWLLGTLTPTHQNPYPWAWVWVWVALGYPRVTCDNH